MSAQVEETVSVFRPDLFDVSRMALFASRCPACGIRSYPTRSFCWRCRTATEPVQTAAAGAIRARSRVRISPAGFPDDYCVAVVDTDDGFVVLGRVDGPRLPQIGARVRLTAGEIRRDGATSVIGPVFTTDDTGERATPAVEERTHPWPSPAPAPALVQPVPPAYIAGVGMTSFGRHDVGAEELAAHAVLAAIEDSGIAPERIGALVVGSAFGARALGQRLLSRLPLSALPVINVENACASGTTALLEAVLRIRAGMAEAVVAVGVDTPLAAGGGLIDLAADDPVAGLGITLPALYALVGDDHLARSGAGIDALAEVVVRSREAAAGNPLAARRSPITRAEVLASRPIADPLTLFQCSANADGAAAVVVSAHPGLAPAPSATGSGSAARPAVRIASLELSAGLTKDRFTPPSAAARVSDLAYAAAGLRPEDVDVVECHDAFSPAVLIALESLGLTPKHTAAQRLLAGDFRGGASGPALNPSGGLLSRGHPPGATGLAQVIEVTLQLRGAAGPRQIADARVGLLHSQGGTVLDLETNACMVGLLTVDEGPSSPPQPAPR